MKIIEKIPEEITPAKLDCLVMPNGDVISCGRMLGRFKDFTGMLETKEVPSARDITG